MPLAPGTILGSYQIDSLLGSGGFGEVYKARDRRLGRAVAIKILGTSVAEDAARRDRFLREARAAAALSHPNIAVLYEVGEDQGRLFMAFELVPGETLRAVIGGRSLNPARAIDFAIQLAEALAEAHAAGIVHRDIKPDNIIVMPKGRLKILDFGLATWMASVEQEHTGDQTTRMVTSVGTTLGTIAYMSPQQALGEPLDHRTDIFSLGIVLFEMLTGRLPFTGTTSTAMALQIVQAPLQAPSSVNSAIPIEIDRIVLKALTRGLDQRYQSASSLAAELRGVRSALDVGATADRPADAIVAGRRRRWSRRVAAALVVTIATAWGWWERDALRSAWRRTLGQTPASVIAVMPFELNGPDQSRLYFADGLTDDVIARLGLVPGLRVIGRSSTRSYRGRDPRAVARQLGAAVVLTGTVQPEVNEVRVTVALVDPSDGAQIWSAQYTRQLRNIFAVQADIATDVTRRLRGALVVTAALSRTTSRVVDQRAYDLYVQGRDRIARRQVSEAVGLFAQAVAVDPGLAEAHAGLAEALSRQATFAGHENELSIAARIQSEVDAAFSVDPDLPQAHSAAALVATDLNEALRHIRAAIAADPSSAAPYHVMGDMINLYAPELSIRLYRASLDLDPYYDANHGDIARSDLLLGRRDDAAREAAIVPSDPVGARLILGETDLIDHRPPPIVGGGPTAGAYLGPWTRYVRGLMHAGRHDLAQPLIASILGLAPGFCEARALEVGELRQMQSARAASAAKAVAALVDGEDPSGVLARCGAVLGAVVGDGARAAASIDRMTAHFIHDDALVSADLMAFDQRHAWYPWNQIAGDARVIASVGRLAAARAKVRVYLPTMLPSLAPSR
jgi:TolB-like protein